MPLTSIRPSLQDNQLLMVKEVLAALTVSHKVFRKYVQKGLIEAVNPGSHRPKYTGHAVMECWDKAILL